MRRQQGGFIRNGELDRAGSPDKAHSQVPKAPRDAFPGGARDRVHSIINVECGTRVWLYEASKDRGARCSFPLDLVATLPSWHRSEAQNF